MYPIWNKIVETNTTFDFQTADCTDDVEMARQYSVNSLPAFIAVDAIGTPIDRRQGFMNEHTFQKWIDSLK